MFFRGGGRFPVTVSLEDCPFLCARSWFDFQDHVHVGSFLGSLFSPGVHVSVFLPVPHCGGHYSSVM